MRDSTRERNIIIHKAICVLSNEIMVGNGKNNFLLAEPSQIMNEDKNRTTAQLCLINFYLNKSQMKLVK